MNIYDLNKYKKAQKTNSSHREVEAAVLSEAALRLERCQDNWESESRDTLLAEALRYNQRLWTVFQSAVCSPDCPLPKDLRTNILRISSFVDRQIFAILSRPSPEALTPIIDINRGLARGLTGRPAREEVVTSVRVKV